MSNNQSVEDFLNSLASKSATPGGGSVAALNGAMGAALVSMVCNLTIGKKKYASAQGETQSILEKSEMLRTKLTDMVAQDAAVFDQVMAAYGLPRKTDAEKQVRTEAIQTALKAAALVPLATAQACVEVVALCRRVVEIGNTNVISDGGVGSLAAQTGLKGAALNVLINLGSIKDKTFVAENESELNRILAGQEKIVDEIYALVQSKL